MREVCFVHGSRHGDISGDKYWIYDARNSHRLFDVSINNIRFDRCNFFLFFPLFDCLARENLVECR